MEARRAFQAKEKIEHRLPERVKVVTLMVLVLSLCNADRVCDVSGRRPPCRKRQLVKLLLRNRLGNYWPAICLDSEDPWSPTQESIKSATITNSKSHEEILAKNATIIHTTQQPTPVNTLRRSSRILQSSLPTSTNDRLHKRAKTMSLEEPITTPKQPPSATCSSLLLGSLHVPLVTDEFSDVDLMMICTASGFQLDPNSGLIIKQLRELDASKNKPTV